MVPGLTSSGMLETQFQGFTQAAKLVSVGDKYIDYGKVMKQQFLLACFISFRAEHITPLYYENECPFVYIELNLSTCTFKVGDLPSPHILYISRVCHIYFPSELSLSGCGS